MGASLTANGKAQRRSQRLLMRTGVCVHWLDEGDQSFEENTHTLVVNAHGALLELATKVKVDQRVSLTLAATGDHQDCRVAYVGPLEEGRAKVGVEFASPNPNFWHVAFPPDDWTPQHPDAKE